MHAEGLLTYTQLFGFLFTLARVSCIFAFVPLAAFRGTSDVSKILLSLAFTMILWPEWRPPQPAALTFGRLTAGLASEAALGVVIGLCVGVVIEVFQVAAQTISLQAGFGFASTIDPNSGADSTVLLTLAQITAGLLFFTTGADRWLVRAMADSLSLCPPESFRLQRGWAETIIRFSALIFGAGLRLAAPVTAILLLTDVTLAVMGRVQTQIQLVSLTMPVKLLGSMLLLAASVSLQAGVFQRMMGDGIRIIEALLRSGR